MLVGLLYKFRINMLGDFFLLGASSTSICSISVMRVSWQIATSPFLTRVVSVLISPVEGPIA